MIDDVQIVTACDMCGEANTEVVRITPLVDCDLCALHKFEFLALISPYVRLGRVRQPQAPPTANAIRQWAKGRGYKVNLVGRIPVDIVEAYHDAH